MFARSPLAIVRLFLAFAVVLVASVGSVASPASSEDFDFDVPVNWTSCKEYSDSVSRLYRASFGRQSDADGFEFWFVQYQQAAWSLPAMADYFAASPEFIATYGALDNRAFVERLYQNVLGRSGDLGGIDFWTEQLNQGSADRGQTLLRFSESPENVLISGTWEPELGYYNDGLRGPFVCAAGLGMTVFELPAGNLVCAVGTHEVFCQDSSRLLEDDDIDFSDVPCSAVVSIELRGAGTGCAEFSDFGEPRPTIDGTRIYGGESVCVVVDDSISCGNVSGDTLVIDGREVTTTMGSRAGAEGS